MGHTLVDRIRLCSGLSLQNYSGEGPPLNLDAGNARVLLHVYPKPQELKTLTARGPALNLQATTPTTKAALTSVAGPEQQKHKVVTQSKRGLAKWAEVSSSSPLRLCCSPGTQFRDLEELVDVFMYVPVC